MALISLPRDTQGMPLPTRLAGLPRLRRCSTRSKINTLYTAAAHAPSLFPGARNGPTPRVQRTQGRARRALRHQDQLLRGGRPAGLPRRDQHARRRDDRRAAPRLRPQVPGQRGQGIDQALHPAGHPVHGRLARHSPTPGHATRPPTSTARHASSASSRRCASRRTSRRCSRPASSTSSSAELKQDVRTDIPPELFPQLVGLAQKVDFNNRISLVLTPADVQHRVLRSRSARPDPAARPTRRSTSCSRTSRRSAMPSTTSSTSTRPIQRQREQLAAEGARVSVLNGTPSQQRAHHEDRRQPDDLRHRRDRAADQQRLRRPA